MKLHGYFRSSASYRVRIALNLKGLRADQLSHHLRKGEQRDPDSVCRAAAEIAMQLHRNLPRILSFCPGGVTLTLPIL